MLKIREKKLKKKKRGFSMLEAVISVFVVAIGLTATMSLVSNGLKHSLDSRDQVIAAQLAQEGIELVRNIRDNNWANGYESFGEGGSGTELPIGIGSDNDRYRCIIDYTGESSYKCDDSFGNDDFTLSYVGGYYKYDVSNKTKFGRRVAVVYYPVSEELEIVSVVSWKNDALQGSAGCNTANKCVCAKAFLTKWGE